MPVQRCIRHKERNVLDHLPERDRPAVKTRLGARGRAITTRSRWTACGPSPASWSTPIPGRPRHCNEGLEETLTLTRLGIRGRLKKTLASTNPIESMIEIIRRTSRNVKRWQNGDMCLRWTAAGMLEAETQFRKIVGYSDLAKLALAVERDLAAQRPTIHTTTQRRTRSPPSPCNHHTPPPPQTSTANGTTSRASRAAA